MRKEQISDALNLITDTFIAETDSLRNKPKQAQKNGLIQKLFPKSKKYWKRAATAACFALIVFAGIRISSQKTANREQTAQTEKLPMLTITENTSDGMGFEGHWAYDISELVGNNPWNEAEQPSALPVYQNQLSYDENYIAYGADFGKMKKLLLETANRFGLDADSLVIMDNAPNEEEKQAITEKMDGDVPDGYFNPTELTAKADGIEITIDQTMSATVFFEPSIAIPKQYHFTHYASYKETASVAEYLKETYKDLIQMENPLTDISDGSYSLLEDNDGSHKKYKQQYQIAFYNIGKNNVETILNYNFKQVKFYCNDVGKLDLIRIYQTDLSQKTGDYPVITADDAKKLLIKGNYITTVPYQLPDEKLIAKTELIYRTGAREEYFMPYYRFYVELPEEELQNGLKTYGAYYVPAVEKKYLKNMPLWDGSFN